MTASRGIALPDSTTPQINGFGEVNKGKAFCFVFITCENLEIIDVFFTPKCLLWRVRNFCEDCFIVVSVTWEGSCETGPALLKLISIACCGFSIKNCMYTRTAMLSITHYH